MQCAAVGLTIISSVKAMKVCLALLYRLHECKETLFSEPGCHMVSAVQQELTEVQLAFNYVFCKILLKGDAADMPCCASESLHHLR